jgi:hypothetical protein
MRRYLLLALLCTAPLLTACPKPAPTAEVDRALARHLAGTWARASGAQVLITYADRKHAVQSIVDSDSEVFQVMRSGWTSEGFTWDYLVPSTGYQVHVIVVAADSENLHTRWSNDHGGSGTEILERQ